MKAAKGITMKIVFVSNFYNHHQAPTALEWYRLCKGNFYFVSTAKVPDERIALGYQNNNFPTFVIPAYKSKEEKKKSITLINNADVVIIGSASDEYIRQRLGKKKLTFRCHERPYKTPWDRKHAFRISITHFIKHKRHKNLYLLCCSAFTAADYAKTNCFLHKAYKWGYFPPFNHYSDIDGLISQKKPDSILWVARFIPCKHPEYVLEVAQRLKAEQYDFHIQMMGNGELWDTIALQIREKGLEEQVELLGAIPSDQVRTYMENAEIFLFTSDRNEGWGAVLNEAMNSGCAVVADRAIGSVPFLLKDGENGLIYDTCDVDGLYERVKYLLDNPEEARKFGHRAYETITEEWNAETAAQRLLELCESLLKEQKSLDLYESGPCSRAEIL